MPNQETEEQRRERLKTLAKERVCQLVRGDDVLPHMDIPGNRLLTAAEADLTLTTLLTHGRVQFPIRDSIVELSKAEIHNKSGAWFTVTVNGVNFNVYLLYTGSECVASVPPELIDQIGAEAVDGKNPFNALFKIIGDRSFSPWLAGLVAKRAKRDAERELQKHKIITEAVQFRDVLVRKYRQLTYVDEYETIEMARFIDEVKRFVAKRLPDVPAQMALKAVVALVSEWAIEDNGNGGDAGFDISMSPTDYERFCADRFAALGWASRLTKISGDQGADIICEANGRRLVVQCKLYSGSVGNAAVQEVIAAREFEYADAAVVVSNAPYTAAARELASTAGVFLLHHDEICTIKP